MSEDSPLLHRSTSSPTVILVKSKSRSTRFLQVRNGKLLMTLTVSVASVSGFISCARSSWFASWLGEVILSSSFSFRVCRVARSGGRVVAVVVWSSVVLKQKGARVMREGDVGGGMSERGI